MADPEPAIPRPLGQSPSGPYTEREAAVHEHVFSACPLSSNQFTQLRSGLAKAASPHPNEEPPLHCYERKVEGHDVRVLQHPGCRVSVLLKERSAYC